MDRHIADRYSEKLRCHGTQTAIVMNPRAFKETAEKFIKDVSSQISDVKHWIRRDYNAITIETADSTLMVFSTGKTMAAAERLLRGCGYDSVFLLNPETFGRLKGTIEMNAMCALRPK